MEFKKGPSYIIWEQTFNGSDLFVSIFKHVLHDKELINLQETLKKQNIYDLIILELIGVDNKTGSTYNRGRGLGSQILNEFIQSVNLPIILLCDELQLQDQGFSLKSFYEKRGFVDVGVRGPSGPIMILIK